MKRWALSATSRRSPGSTRQACSTPCWGDFADIELHPDIVSNEAMGYIIEALVRKFSEMSNEMAGEHYTPCEVIRLMVELRLGRSPARS